MGALATHLLKPDVYPSFESLKSIYIQSQENWIQTQKNYIQTQ